MLGIAGVPAEGSSVPNESDTTIIAPLADEINELLDLRSDSDNPETVANEDASIDSPNAYAEGEDFLRSVTQEFENE